MLARHETYFPNVPHFDLDFEIEKQSGQKIKDIFAEKGESHFRHLEIELYKKLIIENLNYVISLGAGFTLSEINSDCEVVFVSRQTDNSGRIFLNRPQLNLALGPLEDYAQKFAIRQSQYVAIATQIYHMPEGIEQQSDTEKKILTGDFKIHDAIYTLSLNEIADIEVVKTKFSCVELRSDLIPMAEICELVEKDLSFKWLVSVRTEDARSLGLKMSAWIDYDIQFMPKNFSGFISCHLDNLHMAIDKVKDVNCKQLKLSPVVETFEDLLAGHDWQQQDPKKRSFLPRSKNGKWLWYRQLAKYSQTVNFVRNQTDLLDQPSAYQWLTLPEVKPENFGAVLGQPIFFSRSPEIHQSFFEKNDSFFTAIEISETEMTKHFQTLKNFGLKYAAVTSPLKKIAFQIADSLSPLAEHFHAANTLVFAEEQIVAENTDVVGFEKLVESLNLKNEADVAVWGGGGTLEMMKFILPQAHFFPARTIAEAVGNFKPKIVIWAAPRLSETQWPPEQWRPEQVIDLNYLENSMGLEYAQRINCSYVSGLGMFKAQALEQQKYWSLR